MASELAPVIEAATCRVVNDDGDEEEEGGGIGSERSRADITGITVKRLIVRSLTRATTRASGATGRGRETKSPIFASVHRRAFIRRGSKQPPV